MSATLEAEVEVDEAEGVSEEPSRSTIELTAREIAIARGEDPDKIDEPLAEEEGEGTDAAAPSSEEAVAEGSAEEAPAAEAEPTTQTTPESTAWVDDTIKFVAEKYGLADDELKSFATREQFTSFVRALDKRLPQAEEKAPEPKAAESTDPRFDAEGNVNLEYFEKNFDEDTMALAKALRASQEKTTQFEQFIESQRAAQQEAAFVAYANAFHDALDARNPDFYGKSLVDGKYAQLDDTFSARRVKVDDQVQLLETGYFARQQTPPPLMTLIDQAEAIVHRGELDAIARQHQTAAARAARQQQLNKVGAQQRRIRPVASTADAAQSMRNAPPSDPYSAAAILAQPSVNAVVQRLAERGPSNF